MARSRALCASVARPGRRPRAHGNLMRRAENSDSQATKQARHVPVPAWVAFFLAAAAAAVPRAAQAEPLRWHFEGGAAHAVTTPQSDEYGFGAEGRLALEVPLARAVGLQVEGGGLWLAHAARPSDPSLADHGDGVAFFGMAGVR